MSGDERGTVRIRLNGAWVEADEGQKLSELLRVHSHAEMPCNGRGVCRKCRVRVTGAVSAPEEAEKTALGEALREGVRLACMTRVEGECHVTTLDADTLRVMTDGDALHVGDPLFDHYGMALDIGTTTLAAKLFDRRGGCIGEAGMRNPQSVFGADVISRIEASLGGEREALARRICQGIDQLTERLAETGGISPGEIDGCVITGNTAMLYFLTSTPPDDLSKAPFRAHRLFGEVLTARALGLNALSSETTIYLPPCISAFVGADSVTALLAAEADGIMEGRLLADIGTNGELLFRSREGLLCCSTAAGPAFEGAGISCGMMGKQGAVDHVYLVNGRPEVTVIGGGTPLGICGSGLLDAVACLLNVEELDETGFLEDEPAHIASGVALTQEDIRAVQLAKGAVCAGIRTLLENGNTEAEQVTQLAIAGGFGSYLDPASAARVGLFPKELQGKVKPLGNAALTGACMLLLDRECRERAEGYARDAVTLELSSNPVFSNHFINEMLFPTE